MDVDVWVWGGGKGRLFVGKANVVDEGGALKMDCCSVVVSTLGWFCAVGWRKVPSSLERVSDLVLA